MNWTVQHASNSLNGSNTRVRIGIVHCSEFLIDIPNYAASLNGSPPSGFSDVVISFKRQLLPPFGFGLSATTGISLPSGSRKISGPGYQPSYKSPGHDLPANWAINGMFTVTWYPSERPRNPTFEPTLSLERDFGLAVDMFGEYVGDYDHQRPLQLLDGGDAWRFSSTQQLDFNMGFGLNSSTVDHYFGFGYSIRLDHLWKTISGNSL